MAENRMKSIVNYFNRNKEHLLNLLKKEGSYLRFSQTKGYTYSVGVGEYAGKEVKLTVALKSGQLNILSINV